MDVDLNALTLGALLTVAGATIMATVVTGLVALIGRLIVIEGQEARLAAFIAAVFVGLLATQAVISGAMQVDIALILAVVISWYSVTRLAMSIHDDADSNRASLRTQL